GLVAGFVLSDMRHDKTDAYRTWRITMQSDTKTLLLDHVDMRPVTTEADVEDRNSLVTLDPDHPGFRDADYRARRNEIAQIALGYIPGSPIPTAPYSEKEHWVW